MNQTNPQWPGWETVRRLGEGSFGSVWEIRRDVFGRTERAALKYIRIPQKDSDAEELQSLGYDEASITAAYEDHAQSILNEYSLMRQLNGNTNVVNCDDVQYLRHEDGFGWDILIRMELLTPLPKALPDPIPPETVIRVGKDLCRALELCRRYRIIHRDIKPSNIFVSDAGAYKLGDFGVAKTMEKTTGGTKTGTYSFMAPEVYSGRPYGHSADIYSLGLVLYWMLNRKRMPFLPLPPARIRMDAEAEARERRLSGEPLPLPADGSEILKHIVLRACAWDPKDRWESPTALREALERAEAMGAAGPGKEPARVKSEQEPAGRIPREAPTRVSPEREPTEPEQEPLVVTPRQEPELRPEPASANRQEATVSIFDQNRQESPVPARSLPPEGSDRAYPDEDSATVGVFGQKMIEARSLPPEENDRAYPDEDCPTDDVFGQKKTESRSLPTEENDRAYPDEDCPTDDVFGRKKTAPKPAPERKATPPAQPAPEEREKAPEQQPAAEQKTAPSQAAAAPSEPAREAGASAPSKPSDSGDSATLETSGSRKKLPWIAALCAAAALLLLLIWHPWSRGTVSSSEIPGTTGTNPVSRLQFSDVPVGVLSAGAYHTAGLRTDGRAIAVGWNSSGQNNVRFRWSHIISVSAGGLHTVGLRTDGTAVAVGRNSEGQCNVSGWTDLVAVSAGAYHTVGLRSDGTAVAVGRNSEGQCNVSGWTDLVAVSAGESHTVGLRSDGTAVAVGYNDYGQCEVSGWTDLVAVSAGGSHTVGLRSDGTVVAVGYNVDGRCNVSGWTLKTQD